MEKTDAKMNRATELLQRVAELARVAEYEEWQEVEPDLLDEIDAFLDGVALKPRVALRDVRGLLEDIEHMAWNGIYRHPRIASDAATAIRKIDQVLEVIK